MGELVEKIRYEADVDDVIAKQKKLSDSGDKVARDQDDAAKKAERGWDRFASGMERNAGKMKMVGAGMTVALTAPLVAFGLQSIDAAADLGESRNKAREVFGQWSADLEQWATSAATSFGLSEGAAIEAAGTFGNLFTSMGLGQSAASDMSKQVVQLAADLGSFNNVDPSEMLEKLRSGLVGEVEPLRTVGINLNAAAVEAKALEMGLTDANGAVTEAGKVQARLALIMEQSANATGDFARTADDAANKSRIVAARYEEMQATIGERLLPMKLKLLEAADGALSIFEDMPGPLQDVTIGMGGLAAAAGPTLMAVGQMATGMSAMKGRLKTVATFMTGPYGLAIAGAVAAVGLFVKAKNDAKAKVEDFAATLDEETGAITENTRAHALARLEQEGLTEAARTLGVNMQDLVDAALGNEDAWRRVQGATDAANASLQGTGDEMILDVKRKADVEDATRDLASGMQGLNRDLDKSQEKWRTSAQDAAEAEGKYLDVAHAIRDGLDPATASMIVRAQEAAAAAGDAAAGTDEFGGEADTAAGKVDELTTAIGKQREQMLALANPMFAAISSKKSLAEADAAAKEALDKFGAGSVEYEAALLRQAEAAIAADSDLGALLESVRSGKGDIGEMRAAFARLHGQDMLDSEAADAAMQELAELLGLASDLEGVDPTVQVFVDPEAYARLRELGRLADAVTGRTDVAISGTLQGGFTARAGGGPVGPGIPYLVGEEGPELRFFNDGPGHIADADTTSRLLEGMSRPNVSKKVEQTLVFPGPVTEHLTGRAAALALRMA